MVIVVLTITGCGSLDRRIKVCRKKQTEIPLCYNIVSYLDCCSSLAQHGFFPMSASLDFCPSLRFLPFRVAILEVLLCPFKTAFRCQLVDFFLVRCKSDFKAKFFALFLTGEGTHAFTVRR